MKNLPLLFLGIFFTLAFSWTGLVLSSVIQWGDMQPVSQTLVDEEGNPIAGLYYTETGPDGEERRVLGQNQPGEQTYPQAISGLAQQGKKVYIREGCMYCHTQQVRPKGFGTDFERGWGDRNTVARDYILQDRVLLGTMRTGPDLTNVGQRIPSREWHMQHLYDPRVADSHKNSIMPPFNYLFEVREIDGEPSPRAVQFGEGHPSAPPEGYEIIPTEDAEALVAYLLSLKLNYELPEAKNQM